METCTRPLTVITDSEDTNRPRPWGTPTHCIVYSRISATRGQMAWFFSALILLVTLILFVSTCKTQTFFATIKTKSIRPNMAPRKPNERQWRSDTKQLQKKNKQKNSNLSLCLVLPLQQWTVTECKPHTLNMRKRLDESQRCVEMVDNYWCTCITNCARGRACPKVKEL